MRKTLQIFAAILLTLAMLSSLVACTSPQKTNTEDTEDTVTVYLRTEVICYRDDDEISNSWRFNYDDKGNLLSVSGRNRDGKEFRHDEIEYDSKGNVTLRTGDINELGSKFTMRCVYEYSNGGSKETSYYDDVLFEETEYDLHGNIVSSINYYGDGVEIWRRSNYEYEYDSNGNLLLKVRYDNGVEVDRYTYEYDSNGNITLEICYCNDEPYRRTEYDENGYPIRYTTYHSSGTYIHTIQYEKLTLSRQQAEKVAKQEFSHVTLATIEFPLVIISE